MGKPAPIRYPYRSQDGKPTRELSFWKEGVRVWKAEGYKEGIAEREAERWEDDVRLRNPYWWEK